MANSIHRRYRLTPWMVRALIPPNYIGTYRLFQGGLNVAEPSYVGRSDTCLRRRLEMHARGQRAAYFDYDIHHTAEQAYVVECAAYHAYPTATNLIHPARPISAVMVCPFCSPTIRHVRAHRLVAPAARTPDQPSCPATTPERNV